MNLKSRIKRLEKILLVKKEEELTVQDMKEIARELGIEDYQFTGQAKGNKIIEHGKDDIELLWLYYIASTINESINRLKDKNFTSEDKLYLNRDGCRVIITTTEKNYYFRHGNKLSDCLQDVISINNYLAKCRKKSYLTKEESQVEEELMKILENMKEVKK